MKLKTVILASIALIAFTSPASLYFVSGGDFRVPKIKYTLETTSPNQEIEVTPYKVGPLGAWNNPDFICDWFVKYDKTEVKFNSYEAIRSGKNGDLGETYGGQGINVNPLISTFSEPGSHKVKIYDEKGNIYQLTFTSPYITELSIDFEKNVYQENKWGVSVQVKNCPNLKRFYYANPVGTNAFNLSNIISGSTNLEQFELKNTDKVLSIPANTFNACTNLSSSMIFNSATNIGSSFQNCPNIPYASFASAINISSYTLNFSKTQSYGDGLKTFGIGDKLESVGTNALWANTKLETIEFTTEQEDWISAWNNHSILPNWFGPATRIEGNDMEATITPYSTAPSIIYTVTSGHPKPTKLKLVRPSK